MIEIPESALLSQQASALLAGKTVTEVINASSPHKFAWYNGDPAYYSALLTGRRIETVKGYGSFVDLCFDKEVHLLIGDGTHMRYCEAHEKAPAKFQLLIVLDDHSFLVFTVAMYGAVYAFEKTFDNPYYQGSVHKLSPLDQQFDAAHFMRLIREVKKDISLKALLATEQRIPGLGNGVLQDILFRARLHPKRKISTLSETDKKNLFVCMKDTLQQMTRQGGRNTEKDLFGKEGGYPVVLSKNTYKSPCPVCGDRIVKEAYLGGSVYYCPTCQPDGKA